jgi:hypothetical protein
MSWRRWEEKIESGETSMKILFIRAVAVVTVLVASSAFAGISGGARASSSSPQLLVVGPVEIVKEREGVAIVLGQKVPLRSIGHVEVGESISLFGVIRSDGSITISSVQHNGQYVPGASPVFLTAVVQSIAPSVGRATVGGLKVDLTSLASLDGSKDVAVGKVVQLVGTQPNNNGLILAQALGATAVNGISGGAVNGISGGAVNGISGGAVNGISGGAVNGISGGARS